MEQIQPPSHPSKRELSSHPLRSALCCHALRPAQLDGPVSLPEALPGQWPE